MIEISIIISEYPLSSGVGTSVAAGRRSGDLETSVAICVTIGVLAGVGVGGGGVRGASAGFIGIAGEFFLRTRTLWISMHTKRRNITSEKRALVCGNLI
jgi:hypothetical protein